MKDISSSYPDITKEFVTNIIKEVHRDVQVLSYKVSAGSSVGDNFTSVMLAIDVEVVRNGKHDTIHLMVKKFPESEMKQSFFEVNLFAKEIAWYSLIYDDIKNEQIKLGMEPIPLAIPLYYSGQSDSGPQNFMAMDNLKVEGYRLVDREKGASYDHAKLVLKELAKLHASSMLLKGKGLPVQEKYKKALEEFIIPSNIVVKNFFEVFLNLTLKIINKFSPRRSEAHRLEQFRGKMVETMNEIILSYVEPYATICHGDSWFNNMMFKYAPNKDGLDVPVDLKLVDWQMTRYGSPSLDLSYFLYTSLDPSIRKEHLQDLLHLYYDTFISTLTSLGLSTSQFSFDEFHADWIRVRLLGYLTGTTANLLVRGPKENVVDLDQFSQEQANDASVMEDKFSCYLTTVEPRCVEIILDLFDEGLDENII